MKSAARKWREEVNRERREKMEGKVELENGERKSIEKIEKN